MSLKGKNKKFFSYKNQDRQNSNFMYKDFEKSDSYHSNFAHSNFNFVSFRAAKMKFCNFSQSTFIGSEFVGTNLRGSRFYNAYFKNTIFNATILDKTIFNGAKFEECYCLNTNTTQLNKVLLNNRGIKFFDSYPKPDIFSSNLLNIIEALRANAIIRRSCVLHLKEGKINTLSVYILTQHFSEDSLIAMLPMIAQNITIQFHTLSYLEKKLQTFL